MTDRAILGFWAGMGLCWLELIMVGHYSAARMVGVGWGVVSGVLLVLVAVETWRDMAARDRARERRRRP